jgi:hypothetical protein
MGQTHAVQAATSTGRHGAYYLPEHYESRTLPLLVFFHGTGGKGSLAILRQTTVGPFGVFAHYERFRLFHARRADRW